MHTNTRTNVDDFHRAATLCRELGLAAWIISTTVERGPTIGVCAGAPAWAATGDLMSLVASTITGSDANAGAAPQEIFPGGWLCKAVAPGDSTRALATLALAEHGLMSQTFMTACTQAGVALNDAVLQERAHAIYSGATAASLGASLRALVQTTEESRHHQSDVEAITTQLTESYESLDALYTIGRSMGRLLEPQSFVSLVCQKLSTTLPFGLVAARILDSADVVPGLRGKLIVAGSWPGLLEHDLRGPIDEVVAGLRARAGFAIVEQGHALTSSEHPQAMVHPLERDGKVIGGIFLARKHGADRMISSYDTQLVEAAAGYMVSYLESTALLQEQKDLFLGTIQAITASIDAKDRYTCGHSERVAHLSRQLALAAGASENEADQIRIAGLVHDVGKIGVPEAVLCKQGKLTDEEFAHIKRHPEIGHHILKDIRPLADVLPGVLYHHEKYDGRGYPARLSGEGIPLLARIIALADTFDAMSSTRSYRPAMPREKVLDEIRRCAGTQFDPALAERFVTLDFSEFDAMVERSRAAEAWASAA